MGVVSTNRNIFSDKNGDIIIDEKEEMAIKDESKFAISTRNIIPSNKDITKESVKKKVKELMRKKKLEEKKAIEEKKK